MAFSQKIDFKSSTSKRFPKPRSISSFYLEIYYGIKFLQIFFNKLNKINKLKATVPTEDM